MKILAIETSCDETAIALLEATENDSGVDFIVHANVTHSQIDLHRQYGGVFPMMAKRDHEINLPIILEKILQQHQPSLSEGEPREAGGGVDYICVTSGPGLEPALWAGIVFAKELGEKWNVPVIPVNHMEGHILSVLVPEINNEFSYKKDSLQFPALALLVSGAHTELVLATNIGDYKIIGKTRDDAVGEAFDKVARMMGLPYPGGPEISKLAAQFSGTEKPEFPRPMIHSKDFDFSFSGLKTAVLYYIRDLGRDLNDHDKIAISHEFQEAAIDVLLTKTKKAVEEFSIQSIIVGGGVSANDRLRERLTNELEHVQFPIKSLTGDNALMIALAGYFKIKKDPNKIYPEIKAEGNLQL